MNKELIEILDLDLHEIREQVIQTVSHQIADDIGRDIKSQLKAKSSAAVEELITDIVDDVANKTFQPVNHWGEKTADEPTTIKDMMTAKIDIWWKQKVDSNGKASGGYSSNQTRAEYYAKKVVSEHVDFALKNEMKKIVEQGKEKLRLAIGKAIADYMK